MKVTLYWGVRNYSDRVINQPLSEASYTASFSGCNFVMGNGIETTLAVNVGRMNDAPDVSVFPSYLVTETGQCWWIITAEKTRQGQLFLGLRRDFLSERWDELQSLPFLCRKATDIDDDSLSWAKYLKTTSLN